MKRLIQFIFFSLIAFGADAQRIKLLQLERYLGDTIGPGRRNYVGLTNTSGDQEYKKLDSIIVRIADSLIAAEPDLDTDEQYFDTAMISGDTLILSIVRDNRPAHRIPLDGLSGDHDWYKVGTTVPPDTITQNKYTLGKVTIGDNASYTESFAVPLSNIRVQEIIIGYSADGESSNLRIGKNSLLNNVFGSGTNNTAIGVNTLEFNTTGDDNFALGARALKNNTTGNTNVAIGADALVANVAGFTNVAIGGSTLITCADCDYNIALGFGSMFDKSFGDYNTGIGSLSLAHNDSSFNVAIGYSSMFDANSSENTAIGYNALYGTSNTGGRNVAIGYEAGRNARGTGNVFLGYSAGRNTSAASFASGNKLFIENSTSLTPLIWGDFLGDSVRINGSFMVTNLTGTMDSLAGWRAADHKIGKIGLGTGIGITSGVLTYTPLIDQFQIIDDTLYISETGDGVAPFFVDLKTYIDTATAGYDTDSQSISMFYIDMDSLKIAITRGNTKSVYLGDLIAILESDNQRFDSAYLDNCTLILSIQRDSVPAHQIDLCALLDDTDDQYFDTIQIVGDVLRLSIHDDGLATHELDLAHYLSSYGHAGTTSYTNTLYNGVSTAGSFTLSAGTGISITGGASGNPLIANTGMITWFLDGLDDAFASTEIFTGNVASFQGAGGITAYLAASGSSTMVIDATGVNTDAQTLNIIGGTSPVLNITGATSPISYLFTGGTFTSTVSSVTWIANDQSATNEIDIWNLGANGSYTTVSNADSVNFVESGSVTITRVGREITIDVPALAGGDHDWYESGTLIPPDNIGDTMYHTGYTGIGIEHPIWRLDVSTDSRIAGHHIGIGTGIVSTLNLRIGKDALQGSVTGTENIAIGQDAVKTHTSPNLILAIGTSAGKLLNGTASDNTIIGHYAMENSTIAMTNTVVGHGVMFSNLAGSGNALVGDFAAILDTAAYENAGIGKFILNSSGPKSVGNSILGYSAMYDVNDSAKYNIAIGYESVYGVASTNQIEYNIGVGYRALKNIVGSSDKNIMIGRVAGNGLSGNLNISIGDSSLTTTAGDNNINLGNFNSIGSVSNNVVIGTSQSVTTAGNIIITNGAGLLGYKMLSSGFVGIGNTPTPTQHGHLTGNLRVTGAYYDSNNEPGTSGQFLSSTATGTDWVTNTGMASFNINGIDDLFAPTAITNGGTIAFQGTNGITAKLPVLGSGTIVIDGAGVAGTTNLAIGAGGNPSLTSSTGSDVVFTDGLGIDFQYVNAFTITAVAADISGTNEGKLTVTGGSPIELHSNTTGNVPIRVVGSGTVSVTTTASNNITITGTGGSGTVTSVGLTGNAGITVGGSPITSSGTMSLTLNGDLNAVENMSTNGFAVRTPGPVWVTRFIGAGPGINVSAGDGQSANPTISAQVVDVVAGNNITVSDVGGTHTVAQPAFTSLATGFSNGMIVHIDGSGTPEGALFTNLPTGLTSGHIMYVDASGTPQGSGSLFWDNGTGTLIANNATFTTISTGTTIVNPILTSIPTYADDAAAGAGGLGSGRLYKTSAGDLRIKL